MFLTGLQGGFYFGEGIAELAYYIAVLATEWKLLNLIGGNTSKTELELYYAIKAINRLDLYAETIYNNSISTGNPNSSSASINGFIARSDNTYNFQWLNYQDNSLGYRFGNKFPMSLIDTRDWSNRSTGANDVEIAMLPFDNVDEVNLFSNTMSQDQAINTLFGLCFIAKLLDNDVVVNELNIKAEAKDIIHRIVSFIRDKPYDYENKYTTWTIIGPDGLRVARGGYAQIFSYAIADLANKYSGIEDHHNDLSAILGYLIWNLIEYECSLAPEPGINIEVPLPAYPFLNSAVNANVISIPLHDYNYSMILKLAAITGTWNKNNLAKSAYTLNNPIYDLVGAVFNDYKPVSGPQVNNQQKMIYDNVNDDLADYYWRHFLNYANCKGPCYDNGSNLYDSNNNVAYDLTDSECPFSGYTTTHPLYTWFLENKFTDPEPPFVDYSGSTTTDNLINKWGEYSGLDYMLFYNLYRLAFFSNYNYNYDGVNAFERTIEGVFPSIHWSWINTSYQSGTSSEPLSFYATRRINCNAVHESNAVVNYYAGNEIIYLPGYEALLGSNVVAQLKEFECAPNLSNFDETLSVITYRLDSITSDATNTLISYPNPSTTNSFTISSSFSEIQNIRVFDCLGRVLLNDTETQLPYTVNSNNWSQGVFFIKVIDNHHKIHYHKHIIQ